MILTLTWQAIIVRMVLMPVFQNTMGMKIIESASSPATDETMALRPNLRPWSAIFILLITNALMFEPARNASSDAMAALGAAPNT